MPDRPLHALLLPPGPQLLDALASAVDGGPAILPLDPATPRAALERLLTTLRPHALVDETGVHLLPGPEPVTDGAALVIATSGSTGAPKAAQLGVEALLHSARATLARLAASPGQRWLCCVPTHHVAGAQVLIRSLVAASTPEIASSFTPAVLAASTADYVSLVPTMLHRALDAGIDLTRFRAILLGGAAPPPDLLDRAAAAGARVVTTYGMSETAGGCVYDGLPLEGVSVALDPTGRIRLAGPVLAMGYRLGPELSRAAFVDGWHLTQDAGRIEPDGRLRVIGRLDDIIVTGGENVSAVEVAGVLSGHPGVADAAAFGRPDPEWGHRIVAVVAAGHGCEPPRLEQLREHVADRLGRAAAPRELVLVDALPRLPGGKLDRSALRQLSTPPAGGQR